MSKCDFEVEFDRDNRTYLAGEQVSGTVRLRVNKTVQCRKVSIKGLWKTHWRGNHASDEYFEQTVFEGELIEGQTYEFKFEFAAGLHPWTYRGHHLNIDHYIHVRIDVPWALDPKYEFNGFPYHDRPSCWPYHHAGCWDDLLRRWHSTDAFSRLRAHLYGSRCDPDLHGHQEHIG